MSKYLKILLIISIIGIIIYLFIKYNKKQIMNLPSNLNEVFTDIKEQYGESIAKNVEKIYRLETNHFKSDQYKNTGSAGMLKFGESFPFGWSSLSKYWSLNQRYAPSGYTWDFFSQNDGQYYNYLMFTDFGGFYTLAEFLNTHKNNPGAWNSHDAAKQEIYNNIIADINTEFV